MGWREEQAQQAKDRKIQIHIEANGLPVKMSNRGCTDILICIAFVVYILFMIIVSGVAFSKGDVSKIALKFDMDLKDCPDTHEKKLFTRLLPNKKVLKLDAYDKLIAESSPSMAKLGESLAEGTDFDLTAASTLYYAVCVKECPKLGDKPDYIPTKYYTKGNEELAKWDNYDVQDLMGFCMPKFEEFKDGGKQLLEYMTEKMGSFARYLNDIVISWPIILIMAFVSMFITVAYLYLLKWLTKPILYFSIFFIFLMGLLITVWCFKRAGNYPDGSDDKQYATGFGVCAAIFTVLYVAFICCQWRNIKIAAEIMGLAGEFISTQPGIITTPFVAYFAMLPIVLWFVFTNVYLYAMGTPVKKERDLFATLEETEQSNWMFWMFLFGFFWICAFLIAIMQFVIAATCTLWYFTYQQSDSPAEKTAIKRSFMWAIKNHPGSLAFGALLIAIVTMLKVVFEYFAKQQEKLTQDNVAVKCVLACIRYYIWCLDACVKFISENAYIQVAITGCNFCQGAQKAFWLLLRNPGTYTAVNVSGWFMTAVGKAAIMGLSVYITMALCDANVGTGGQTIQQPFIPAFIVLLIAWQVAAFFISLFDFATLTILQSFLVSKEYEGPLFAPDALIKLIEGRENQQLVERNRTKGGSSTTTVVVSNQVHPTGASTTTVVVQNN